MKKEIQEGISFLMKEFKRLKEKQKKENLSKEEIYTLKKLESFLGKTKNEKILL